MARKTRSAAHRVRVRALAKINLSLRVLGTRPDGFHELRTTLQSLALHDTLTLTSVAGPMVLTCDIAACPADESNLVWQAAERRWRADGRAGTPVGVHIDICKRVPIQAGLGGGSSDAAAALRGLAVLWGTRVNDADLLRIARGIGADVAFFFEGGTSLGVDRGDILYPLADRQKASVVLVMPGFGVSTRDAYAWWDADHAAAEVPGARRAPTATSGAGDTTEQGNDLQPSVAARHPEIARLVRRLARLGSTHAAMSGSGSTVFGLFERQAEAIEAAAALTGRPRIVLVSPTVNRQDYRRLARPQSVLRAPR